jgi:hypothetical protein
MSTEDQIKFDFLYKAIEHQREMIKSIENKVNIILLVFTAIYLTLIDRVLSKMSPESFNFLQANYNSDSSIKCNSDFLRIPQAD